MKKSLSIIAGFILLFGVKFAVAQQPDSDRIWIAAHRGAHLTVPENSLASIDEAIRAGADIVEMDVRETRDGILVMLHDKTLDRTTTGKGELSRLTYAETQELYLTHQGKATPYRIPTFRETLAYLKDRIIIDIDFKISGMEARKKAYEIIEELDMESQVLFFLYDYTEMDSLYKINPRIKMMPRAYNNDQMREIIDKGQTDIIHLDPSFENSPLLPEARQKGIRLWMNTLGEVDNKSADNQEVYREFLAKYKYMNILQTDFPARLKEAVGKR
ncbi:MAG: glycerophosphodiester phosphodiesterase family protein [Leadbetterella sp.]|nr:glycerophosphodiester phosphodiesterase family protein [Leadbetterella sp.]